VFSLTLACPSIREDWYLHIFLVHSTLCTMHPTRETILRLIKESGRLRPRELYEKLDIRQRAVFKQLKALLAEGLIEKIGTPPHVFYKLAQRFPLVTEKVDEESENIIDENFYLIDSSGSELVGMVAFSKWCEQRKLPLLKTAGEYASSFKKFNFYKNTDGLIDGTTKIKNTFTKCYLDSLYYLDFYSIERFGKTKLGQMLLYAKQSQNRILIRKLVEKVKSPIEKLAKNFDLVCFIPPTINRGVQLMKELEKGLYLPLPKVQVIRVRGQIAIAQKTLSRLEDRIENASRSVVVETSTPCQKVLIIDDAVGSGAMMNEIAKQLKEKNAAIKTVGVAITGSFKGFDIISEV